MRLVRYVIDYVAQDVLKQQSPARRNFLRQTAILDRLCASLCDAVTGQHESQAMLAELERANLFLIPLDDKRQWYRYHDLFAEFLRTEVAEADQHTLHQRASERYEAHAYLPEAIRHALAAQNTTAAVRLIRQTLKRR